MLAQARMQHTHITAAHIRMCVLRGTKIDVNPQISRFYYRGLCVVTCADSAFQLHASAMSAFWILNDETVQQTFTTLLRRQRFKNCRAGQKTQNDRAGKKTQNDCAGKKRVRLLMHKGA